MGIVVGNSLDLGSDGLNMALSPHNAFTNSALGLDLETPDTAFAPRTPALNITPAPALTPRGFV